MSFAQYIAICILRLSPLANDLSYILHRNVHCPVSVLPNVSLDYLPMIVIYHIRHTGMISVQNVTICLLRLSPLQKIYHMYHTEMSSVLCVTICLFRLPAHANDLSRLTGISVLLFLMYFDL